MPNTPPNLIANGNIRTNRFVRIDSSTDWAIIEGADNSDIIGISMDASDRPPQSDLITTHLAARDGQGVRIYGDGEVCLLEAGAAVVRGNRLKSDAQGRGTPVATTGTTLQRYGAVALQSAAAAGELFLVQIQIGSERPALV